MKHFVITIFALLLICSCNVNAPKGEPDCFDELFLYYCKPWEYISSNEYNQAIAHCQTKLDSISHSRMKADQKYTYSVRIVSLISYLYSYGENYAEAIRTWEDFQPENSVDSLTKSYVVSANKAIGFHDIGQKDSADFYILDMASVIKEIMNQNQGIDGSLFQDSVIAQDREISFNTETELILTYSYYCHLAAVVGESVWKEFDNYIQSTDQKECIEKYRKRVQLEDAKNFFPLEVPNKLVNVLLNR